MKRRVLVADDNRAAAESLAELLSLQGYRTRIAADGQQAIEAAEAFRPHMILMDLRMPGVDGYAAAPFMRAQPWGQAITLIALTGWGQDADRLRAQDVGFDHRLVKPVDPEGLRRLLSSLLTRGSPDAPVLG